MLWLFVVVVFYCGGFDVVRASMIFVIKGGVSDCKECGLGALQHTESTVVDCARLALRLLLLHFDCAILCRVFCIEFVTQIYVADFVARILIPLDGSRLCVARLCGFSEMVQCTFDFALRARVDKEFCGGRRAAELVRQC